MTDRLTPTASPVRVAYADPPYPGCAGYYKDHPTIWRPRMVQS